NADRRWCWLRTGPQSGMPAAHSSICLALLPSGPDAVRRLELHRFRTAMQSATYTLLHVSPVTIERKGRKGRKGKMASRGTTFNAEPAELAEQHRFSLRALRVLR